MSTIYLAPSGHYGSGVRSAPHSILGYRNSLDIQHSRISEIHCGIPLDTVKSIETTLTGESNYVVLGGDHTITLGILRAISTKEKPYLVMFDAHTDEYTDKKSLDCGNWLKFAKEENVISGMVRHGCRGEKPSSYTIPKSGHIHITVDIDVLEPSEYGYASTYNESGGMSLDQLLSSILAVRKKSNASITADIVEYDSFKDMSGAGRFACSQILDTLLSVIDA